MSLIRGPFTIKFGSNEIEDVEEIAIDHVIASEDYETVQGRTLEVDGPYKVSAVITLLASDLPVLAVCLPQHFVANGEVMSTGETVEKAAGAIDVVAHDCDTDIVYNDLDIMSCANPANVLRLVNCRTKLEGISVDNKIQKIMVKFVGESAAGEASVQMFKDGTIHVVS